MNLRKNCYNCNSSSNEFYFRENGFDLHQCKSCNLIFVTNPPKQENILNSHQQGMHRGVDKDLVIEASFQFGKVKYLNSILKSMFKIEEIKSKKWLDIGSGTGEFILAIKNFTNNNVDVIGSEPNLAKQKVAIERKINTTFIDIENTDDKYDYISMLNVYSHIYDPIDFIKKLKKLLKPCGEIFIETSDTVNLTSKQHYKPFYLPDHLSFASEKILKDIFLKNGFKFISIKKTPLVKGGLYKLFKELIKFFLPNYNSHLIKMIKYRETDIFLRFQKID
jgi:2-polyprenyl-3-methyl-5-hydroxy-6-metoxy-1,4-benzoquinol methylase